MLRLGKGSIMKMLIKISYLWNYLRGGGGKLPFFTPKQWR